MEESLKVLSVSTSDTSGGAAKAAYRIHHGVRKLHIDSRMFVKNKFTNDESIIQVLQFEPRSVFWKIFRYIQNKIKNKMQRFRWDKYPNRDAVFLSDLRSIPINGALQKTDYDILHLHWFNLRFLDIKELSKVRKSIVWTLHDSWAFTGICHYTYNCNRFEFSCGDCPFLHSNNDKDLSHQIWQKKNKVYNKLNIRIITPSQWLADCVKRSSLLGRFAISVIPNGLDTNLYSPGDKQRARKNACIESTDKIILFGAVNPTKDKNKGFAQLITAIQYLEHTDQNISLAIFGTNEPIQFHTRYPVFSLGHLYNEADLVNAYRLADVMIVPSLSEVFGQTASEAMSCGLPVVAFNCTGIKEVVDHKTTGYLAEPYKAKDLANGIIWCLENNHDQTLSINARKKAIETYSIEKISQKYVQIYNQINAKQTDAHHKIKQS